MSDTPLGTDCRLFIYGTLAPGRSNHHIMNGMTGVWQKAVAKGHLGSCEWGPYKGYPGFTPSEHGTWVDGYLFSSPDLPQNWQRLDDFEGEQSYKRPDMCIIQ